MVDGYDSLLSKSEGGDAEEIVSEENGMLLSTLLRLYFLSLKVLGKWKHWSHSLGRHYGHVQEKLHESHPCVEPQTPSKETVDAFSKASKETAKEETTSRNGTSSGSGVPHDESDDEHSDLKPVPTNVSKRERELVIMRKVMRKWWRLAGLSGHPNLCDELGEGEFTIHWTKAVAPRLEGRIKLAGAEENKS